MLEFIVCVEVAVVFVVVTQVEVEKFVDEVVDWFLGFYVEVFYSGLHHQILVYSHERQQQIFISVVGPLKVHIEVEVILKYIAAHRLCLDEIPGRPLVFGHPTLKLISFLYLLKSSILFAEIFEQIQSHMHPLVIYIRKRL